MKKLSSRFMGLGIQVMGLCFLIASAFTDYGWDFWFGVFAFVLGGLILAADHTA